MKNIIPLWALYFLIFSFIGPEKIFADAEIFPAPSFKQLHSAVLKFGEKNIDKTLIVMDDDDTLTMMQCDEQSDPQKCQYLGGPAWYAWQSNLIKKNDNTEYRVAKTEEELLQISALLLDINDMPYTDSHIPSILASLTDKGAKLLVLTARGHSNLSASESQFTDLPAHQNSAKNFLSFIRDNALKGRKSGIASFAGPTIPSSCQLKRPIAYQQGVMYASGQNKGEMLKCLLGETESGQITKIAFIDDTLKNVEDVYSAYELNKHYNVKAMHYTLLAKHKQALTKGKNANKYQKEAHKRWLAIKHALKKNLLKPAIANTN
jgi:hypothetical protein